ncbi:unnamed protein product [Adineta steineri]|uniref:Uncharacterized protein n=1 Tax=Adineta steineri TaxID=433720 RepID=A0A815L7U8_9BILA|nr:unnamed protein product [Adineta steineri]CAF1404174.1 unnamed protein product [Adineta steineri]
MNPQAHPPTPLAVSAPSLMLSDSAGIILTTGVVLFGDRYGALFAAAFDTTLVANHVTCLAILTFRRSDDGLVGGSTRVLFSTRTLVPLSCSSSSY